ncbi:hypothetical protein CWE08_00095 [Aliidiomarina iranensis]|uniref:TonB-dependent receptor n=1 Tax=Aliidiomarina iranensis TaxID=1434071 RepID=A0A432W1I8_9GAMM|nr:TonB-dependent receptor [Aliidiomarina iranensis]RUO23091.1 hypothetical protein CWE08_00095 [Aliidiomarina iranensis]
MLLTRSKNIKLAVIASFFFNTLFVPAGAAQEATEQASLESAGESPELEAPERIVVTATRTARPWISTPASVERVDLRQQAPGMRTDAAELLQGIAGLQVDTRFNFAQDTRITLRGFGARAAFGVRGVRLRLDGIPLSMPDGQAQTSSILLDEPRSVEVLRGPLAAIHGNSAGGVIDLQSERPWQSYVSANLSTGSANRERQHIRGVYVDEIQSFSADYARFRTDGDREQSNVKRDQWALRWYRDITDDIELIARIDDNDAPLLQDPSALSPTQWREDPTQTASQALRFNTRKTIRHQQQSLTLRQLNQPNLTWQASVWNGQRDIEQYLGFPGSAITASGAVIDLQRSFTGANASATVSPLANTPWQLTLALDHEKQKDERLGFVNDFGVRGDLRRNETGRVESTDVSVISDWQFAEQWVWVAGLRTSQIDFTVNDRFIVEGNPDDSGAVDYRENAWSSGLNYQFSDDLSIFVATGEGFETPTLTEMAYQNEGSGLNTDLQPARIRQHEVGIKLQKQNLRLQSSVFLIDSRNDLVVDQNNDGRTTYRNAAETEREGFEISGRWDFHPNASWQASYTWLNARYGDIPGDSASGQRLPGLARSNLFQQWEWRPYGDRRAQLLLAQRLRSRVATSDANDSFAPSYTLWDFAIRGEIEYASWLLEPWFRVENITDKAYVGSVVVNQGNGRTFEPAPGRIWMAGVTLRY